MKFNAILLVGVFLLLSRLVNAQESGFWFATENGFPVPNGAFHAFTGDTTAFHLANLRFEAEVAKKGELDLDTLRLLGNRVIQESKEVYHDRGVIKTYFGFGSGYLSKVQIDSALHYYLLAIDRAAAIRDTLLLSKAYSLYGWALVYDNSDYEGAIDNSLIACSLAKAYKDTALIINVTTKLVKIYFQASKLVEAFELCTDLQDLCEIRKDTSAQINNYYMFGSIYARMNLFDKQMKMVYKGQEMNANKNDTLFLYTKNLTASNAYLFDHQYDSVLYYSRLNLPFCAHLNLMPNCYGNIAKAYLETDQLDSARYYYNLIMDYHVVHDTYIDTYLYLDQGRIEFKSGRYAKALDFYKKAEADISKPSLSTQVDIYKALHEFYDFQQQTEASLYYLKKYKTWSDSLSNQQYGMSVDIYESSLLKKQFHLLSKENEYQTVLAKKQINEKNITLAGSAMVILLILFGFYRFKRQRSFKHTQMLMQERLRISRELHDEVGATLSGIAMYSHVATEQLKNEKIIDVQHSLSFMQTSAGEMVNKLSDIVWLINPEQDTIMEIFGRLGEYGKQMTRARNMQIRIDLPADLANKHIPLEARRNIYLFCKEAINNAVKYSNGKLLVLQAKSLGPNMVFSVTDDGNGFDESIVRRGNGLVNMQKRANDIGAVFQLDTKMNQGTKLELQYKIIQ
jgi:signal transduction histidine kinase